MEEVIWRLLAKAVRCGGCHRFTTAMSPKWCQTCGKILCGKCGLYCLDHRDAQEVQVETDTEDS
jgi:hypothetical protein